MAEYACKCLNIRIRAQPTGGSPPVVQGGEFVPVHVGDQGISAVHPELTLRSRTRAKSSADSNMLRRHICLTCLNCSSLVYRIEHIEPANMEGGEGPVLPTDEWAEHEVLRTSSGWIELSKGCLDQESIAKAAASKSYSPLFRVILPSPTITEMLPSNTPSTSTPKPANPSEALHTCLPPLSPLFPPPPFTPSHPTFSHLSSLATDQSQKIRQAAEDYLAEITRVKVAEIERQEDDLRRQVQLLWAHFRESLAPFEQEKKELRRVHAHPHSTSEWSQSGAPAGHGTPVSVHDFVPVASPSRLRSASPPIPRVHSALSASLVTTSMHPPRAAQQSETRSEISSHPSETLAEAPEFIDPATSLREAYRRDVDEEKDIATSLKYVFNMEEAGAAVRGRQGRRNSASDSRSPEGAVKPTPGDFAKSPTRMEPIAEASGSGTVMATSPKAEEHVQEAPSPGKSKGKRKVTFDIKPDIAPSAEEASAAQQNGVEEAIFDLDQETADRPENEDPNAVKLSLPLLEPPHMPARPAHRRSTSAAPAPSKANGDSASAVESKKPEEEPLSPREAELLRLVAADVPSHRNGWKRDSKAWQTFVTRQGGKSKYPAALSFDEEEEDDENGVLENGEDKSGVSSLSSRNGTDFGVLAASLPISIHPQAVRRHSASVLSYQPKTSLTDHYGSLVPPLPLADGTRYGTSSAAIRKAAYAERDRGRSLDPGALDFATDDDDEKSDNEEGPGRGRNHALKILQARSELPPEGMWRSLAT
ncbi:hypothetical protein EVG20_g85 [Dentipellis fragilis]|uniref:Uncharacterized protein n=1 Tax=Dentipellis fragilis TaxID=205917 RepID=A0A4Y9ZDN7_9AGAM|nr:hypothetical protein EVG20_g85 [Dentipellis fragilis]